MKVVKTFDSKSEKVKEGLCFMETATIILDGKEFASGGGFLLKDKNGKFGGLLYAYEKEGKIGDWSGKCKVSAHFGNIWCSNMGDKRQSVYFSYDGHNFYGVYFKSNSDIVRVREIES